jgi:uncharacterized protein YkwD
VRRVAPAVLLIAFALAAGAADAGSLPWDDRAPAASAAKQISQMPDLQAKVLTAINEVRRAKGLHELRLSSGLSAAALQHSVSMAQRGFFDHSGFDGSPFWLRIKSSFRPRPHAYWGVGETLVWASPDLRAAQAVELWLKSPEHRKILLTSSWREIGVGGVHALAAPGVYHGQDVTILTADFGVR